MKVFRNPQNVHQPVGLYNHQVEIDKNERILIISGQVGVCEDGTVPLDPLEQFEVAFDNVLRNLRTGNMEIKDILKITYYVVGHIDPAKRHEIVGSKLQGHIPCSTFLCVAGLANPAYKVEIEAMASRIG